MPIIGAVIVIGIALAGVSVILMAAAVGPAPVAQPLNREQPWLSLTEAQRLRDRQPLNKYFLQSWRERPTRPNLD